MREELTETDRRILAIERKSWNLEGNKMAIVADELGLKWANYYQRVNQLIDTEAALAYDPVTVNRLRRIREQKLRARGHTAATRAAIGLPPREGLPQH